MAIRDCNWCKYDSYDEQSEPCVSCSVAGSHFEDKHGIIDRYKALEKSVENGAAGDTINSPFHYTRGKVECIDAIESALTPDEFRGYCKGNAIKYIHRERYKGQDESIEKAIWYLRRIVKPIAGENK